MGKWIAVAIVAAIAAFYGKRKDGEPDNGPGPIDRPEDENGEGNGETKPEPVPDGNKQTSKEKREFSTLLSQIGYKGVTPNSTNIPYSVRSMFAVDWNKVRSKVAQGKMTRVWPLKSPTSKKRIQDPLGKEALAAARWAVGTQAAGIAWQSLVTQARGL